MLTHFVAGSLADVPKDLLKEVEQLERLLTVDTAKLKQITDHFVKELEKGLSVEGGSIVSRFILSIIGHQLVAFD